jgi:hypothetical protein
VQAPADLAEYCAQPEPLKDDSLASITDTLIDNTAALADCYTRQKKLSDWVTKK